MTRRGLTLLELLITLALVLALAAVALPTLLDGLEERSLQTTAETICAQIMLARAEAQESGRAVAIVYHPRPPRVLAMHVQEDDGPRTRGESSTRSAPGQRDDRSPEPGSAASATGPEGEEPARPLAASWARQSLARGLKVQTAQPRVGADAGRPAPPTFPPDDDLPVTDVDADRPIRVAVLLPDGSALMPRPVWLTDASGRAMKITANAWTGAPELERSSTGAGAAAERSTARATDEMEFELP